MRNWALAAAILPIALAGCVSFGEDPPDQLLTLTATSTAPAGAATDGPATAALAVIEPSAPQALNVTRVPVQLDPSGVAYLRDAMWVEKPARLFQRLLAETIRARSDRLVVDMGDLQYAATTALSGQLLAMGYDAAQGSVVVRYDAVLTRQDGTVRTRRFEQVVPGVAADVRAVGPALNQAANALAVEVADWVG